jgi:hypothetical protein
MGKTGTKTGGGTQNSFSKIKSYSISEIMAAGGCRGFCYENGKDISATYRPFKKNCQKSQPF